MKGSARNQFPGKITEVKKGAVGAIVKVRADGPCDFTAFITKEAVEDLKLKKGDKVSAVVKATEVMIFK
jgi:molybdate transport system regulatory protein